MTNNTANNESRSVRRKRMVAEMSNLRTLKWIGVALGIHLILIGATSKSTIETFMREHHVFGLAPLPVPPPAEEAKAPETPAATQPTTAPVTPVAGPKSEEDKRLADLAKGGNREAQNLTATPKPGEGPKAPSHGLGDTDGLDAPK